MFKKKYLSAYITDENVTAVEFNTGVLINEPTSNILKLIGKKANANKSIYEENGTVGAILNYCVDKMNVGRTDSVFLVLNAPAEFQSIFSGDSKSVTEIIGRVNQVKKMYRMENVVTAQIGSIKWAPDDLSKRFLIYSEDMKTYVYLVWAGGLVDFVCIEKRQEEVSKDDILAGINSISSRLTEDIPDRFKKNPNIKKFKHSWSDSIEDGIYVIVPDKIKDIWGENIDKYNLNYLPYKDNVVIKGSKEVMKFIM